MFLKTETDPTKMEEDENAHLCFDSDSKDEVSIIAGLIIPFLSSFVYKCNYGAELHNAK